MKESDPWMSDLFRALKPILGPAVDQLWFEYERGDPKRKARIKDIVLVLAVKHLGIAPGDEKIRLEPPPPEVIGGGPYVVGSVLYPGKAPCTFTLYPEELLQHVFVLARSGSGKTSWLLYLLEQLTVSWCALDWKRNYRVLLHHPRLQDLLVLTVGSDVAPLRVNMLRPPRGVSIPEWLEAVSEAISEGYLLLQGARNVLKKALFEAIASMGERTTLRDAIPNILLMFAKARFREAGWLESAKRALEELTTGPFGDALNARGDAMHMEDLLNRPVVMELEGLGYDQGKTFCIFYLQTVKLTRKRQSLPKEVLHHVTLADEAHNIFTKEKRGDPPSVQSTVARELRELGEGIITSTQQTDISESIIANSGTTIVMKTVFPWDVKLMSDMLQVDPRYLGKIPLGQGIARLPYRYPKAFLFSFPPAPIKNALITDDVVRRRYDDWMRTRAPVQVEQELPVEEVGSREHLLLLDIAAVPISKVTERYARLGWNPKTGTEIQNAVLRHGLADFVTLEIGRGSRVKLLTLTAAGEAIVRSEGGTIRRSGPAGMLHEFWRSRIRERCENRGYTVTDEYHLGNGKRVDLLARSGDRRLLIEIETGRSDIAENVAKCQGHGELVVFCTTPDVLAAAALPDGVVGLTPETLAELHKLLW
jgi:hypothetical protein